MVPSTQHSLSQQNRPPGSCSVLYSIRRDLVDAFKKAQKDGMPEDAAKDGEESAQKLTDKYAKKVDDLFSAKEKEIMTV